MGQSHPPLQDLGPLVRRAISLSKHRKRQVWLVWTGRRIAVRNSCRRGRGILIARIIGEEVFPSDLLTYEGMEIHGIIDQEEQSDFALYLLRK